MFVICSLRFADGVISVKPTIWSMSLAVGTTDDRARLCSLKHSSMNPSSDSSGSWAGVTMDFARTQAHRNVLTALVMFASWHQNADWERQTYHRKKKNRNKKCVLGSVTWRLYNTKPFPTFSVKTDLRQWNDIISQQYWQILLKWCSQRKWLTSGIKFSWYICRRTALPSMRFMIQ